MIGKEYFPTSVTPSPQSRAEAGPDTLNILVVDDIPDILYYFKGVLRRVRGVDFRVTIEANSSAALERVKSEPYQLVITDFRMKGVNGLEILQAAYRANPGGLRVLMTGYNEIPASIGEIRDASVDAYLQKPLSAHDLLLLLHDLLRGNATALEQMRSHARDLEALAEKEECGVHTASPPAYSSNN